MVVVIWVAALVLLVAAPTLAETLTFQQGSNGYDRAQDTEIRWAFETNFGDTPEYDSPHSGDSSSYEMYSTNGGRRSILEVGHFFQRATGFISGGGQLTHEAGPTYRYSRFFIRFREVFGTGPGQVPADMDIKKATLKLYNTEDGGAKAATGAGYHGDTINVLGPGGVQTRVPNLVGQPRMNAGTIEIYPLLTDIRWGFNDGLAKKGVVTADHKRRYKENWSQLCISTWSPNDPVGKAFDCGPADVGDPDIGVAMDGTIDETREAEYDSSHPGVVAVFQNADPGFKEFDVTGLMDFITGDGVYVAAYSPPGELPTLDINYGNAYRSSEFGDVYDKDGNLMTGGSAADIATRPMLMIEFGGLTIPGDVNGDGLVDVADLGVVGANFGSTQAMLEDGDFTGDGNVDVADLGVVGANWTASQTTGNVSDLVPEPATLSLLLMSVLMVRRRGKHNTRAPR